MVNPKHQFGGGTTRAEILHLSNDRIPRGTPVTPVAYTHDSIAAAAAASGRAGARACACAYTREGEDGEAEAMATLCDYYRDTFGRQHVPVSVRRDMQAALRAGMEPEVLMLAMDDTACAQYPGWGYTMAIVRRCLAEGCHTPEAWAARKAAHVAGSARHQPRAAAPARAVQDYMQREYRNEDYAVDTVMREYQQRDRRAAARPSAARDYTQREYRDEDFAVDAVQEMWQQQEQRRES